MNCATHQDIAAVAFCRTCGKPLCGTCTRDVRGVIYCEPCLAARLEGTAPAAGFVPPTSAYPPVGTRPWSPRRPRGLAPTRIPQSPASWPDFFPSASAPFTARNMPRDWRTCSSSSCLSSAPTMPETVDWVFGIGIAFFYVYQIIDAVRTAKALQAGQPAPDPLGLGQTFSMGEKFDSRQSSRRRRRSDRPGRALPAAHHGHHGIWLRPLLAAASHLFRRLAVLPQREPSRSRTCSCGRCSTRWLMGPAMVLTTGILFLLQSLRTLPILTAPGPPGFWWSASSS